MLRLRRSFFFAMVLALVGAQSWHPAEPRPSKPRYSSGSYSSFPGRIPKPPPINDPEFSPPGNGPSNVPQDTKSFSAVKANSGTVVIPGSSSSYSAFPGQFSPPETAVVSESFSAVQQKTVPEPMPVQPNIYSSTETRGAQGGSFSAIAASELSQGIKKPNPPKSTGTDSWTPMGHLGTGQPWNPMSASGTQQLPYDTTQSSLTLGEQIMQKQLQQKQQLPQQQQQQQYNVFGLPLNNAQARSRRPPPPPRKVFQKQVVTTPLPTEAPAWHSPVKVNVMNAHPKPQVYPDIKRKPRGRQSRYPEAVLRPSDPYQAESQFLGVQNNLQPERSSQYSGGIMTQDVVRQHPEFLEPIHSGQHLYPAPMIQRTFTKAPIVQIERITSTMKPKPKNQLYLPAYQQTGIVDQSYISAPVGNRHHPITKNPQQPAKSTGSSDLGALLGDVNALLEPSHVPVPPPSSIVNQQVGQPHSNAGIPVSPVQSNVGHKTANVIASPNHADNGGQHQANAGIPVSPVQSNVGLKSANVPVSPNHADNGGQHQAKAVAPNTHAPSNVVDTHVSVAASSIPVTHNAGTPHISTDAPVIVVQHKATTQAKTMQPKPDSQAGSQDHFMSMFDAWYKTKFEAAAKPPSPSPVPVQKLYVTVPSQSQVQSQSTEQGPKAIDKKALFQEFMLMYKKQFPENGMGPPTQTIKTAPATQQQTSQTKQATNATQTIPAPTAAAPITNAGHIELVTLSHPETFQPHPEGGQALTSAPANAKTQGPPAVSPEGPPVKGKTPAESAAATAEPTAAANAEPAPAANAEETAANAEAPPAAVPEGAAANAEPSAAADAETAPAANAEAAPAANAEGAAANAEANPAAEGDGAAVAEAEGSAAVGEAPPAAPAEVAKAPPKRPVKKAPVKATRPKPTIRTTTPRPTIDPDLLADINEARMGQGLPLLQSSQVDELGNPLPFYNRQMRVGRLPARHHPLRNPSRLNRHHPLQDQNVLNTLTSMFQGAAHEAGDGPMMQQQHRLNGPPRTPHNFNLYNPHFPGNRMQGPPAFNNMHAPHQPVLDNLELQHQAIHLEAGANLNPDIHRQLHLLLRQRQHNAQRNNLFAGLQNHSPTRQPIFDPDLMSDLMDAAAARNG